METFQIQPLSQFESGTTSIKRPRHFLQFSFDEEHKIQLLSDSSLRYYYPPFVEAPGTTMPQVSLSPGFEKWVRADDTVDNHLDGLLQTIQAYEESLLENGTEIEDVRVKADVITWRGMMTKIMSAAFDRFSDFEMNATCFQGTIYIEENFSYGLHSEQKSATSQRYQGKHPELQQYWGYKFETLSTLPKPWAECSRQEIDGRDAEIVNNNAQYCSIVRTGIGETSLVIGGEVDCIMGEKPEDPNDPIPWIELKTTAELSIQANETRKFENKLCRFWAQSFLLGVPKIVVGFRTPDGDLTRIQELETQKIPGLVARSTNAWNGNVCINMTGKFLEFLKRCIGGQDGVWRIKRKRNEKYILVAREKANGTGDVLRERFKRHREKLLATEIAHRLGRSNIASSEVSDGTT